MSTYQRKFLDVAGALGSNIEISDWPDRHHSHYGLVIVAAVLIAVAILLLVYAGNGAPVPINPRSYDVL